VYGCMDGADLQGLLSKKHDGGVKIFDDPVCLPIVRLAIGPVGLRHGRGRGRGRQSMERWMEERRVCGALLAHPCLLPRKAAVGAECPRGRLGRQKVKVAN